MVEQARQALYAKGDRDLPSMVDVVLRHVPHDPLATPPGPPLSGVERRSLEFLRQIVLRPPVQARREARPRGPQRVRDFLPGADLRLSALVEVDEPRQLRTALVHP